jgi:hypothetical protein
MRRLEIHLPDETFARAKKLCGERKVSLSELARLGIERLLSTDSPEPTLSRAWELPRPRRLGWKELDDAELKRAAQMIGAGVRETR